MEKKADRVLGRTPARGLSSLVYGVSTTDPPTYLTSAFVLTAVTILAAFVPAYRAARTDPLEAIRE